MQSPWKTGFPQEALLEALELATLVLKEISHLELGDTLITPVDLRNWGPC